MENPRLKLVYATDRFYMLPKLLVDPLSPKVKTCIGLRYKDNPLPVIGDVAAGIPATACTVQYGEQTHTQFKTQFRAEAAEVGYEGLRAPGGLPTPENMLVQTGLVKRREFDNTRFKDIKLGDIEAVAKEARVEKEGHVYHGDPLPIVFDYLGADAERRQILGGLPFDPHMTIDQLRDHALNYDILRAPFALYPNEERRQVLLSPPLRPTKLKLKAVDGKSKVEKGFSRGNGAVLIYAGNPESGIETVKRQVEIGCRAGDTNIIGEITKAVFHPQALKEEYTTSFMVMKAGSLGKDEAWGPFLPYKGKILSRGIRPGSLPKELKDRLLPEKENVESTTRTIITELTRLDDELRHAANECGVEIERVEEFAFAAPTTIVNGIVNEVGSYYMFRGYDAWLRMRGKDEWVTLSYAKGEAQV
jgi:hypothetical protein